MHRYERARVLVDAQVHARVDDPRVGDGVPRPVWDRDAVHGLLELEEHQRRAAAALGRVDHAVELRQGRRARVEGVARGRADVADQLGRGRADKGRRHQEGASLAAGAELGEEGVLVRRAVRVHSPGARLAEDVVSPARHRRCNRAVAAPAAVTQVQKASLAV